MLLNSDDLGPLVADDEALLCLLLELTLTLLMPGSQTGAETT